MLLQLRKRLLFNIIGIYKLVTWSKSEGHIAHQIGGNKKC